MTATASGHKLYDVLENAKRRQKLIEQAPEPLDEPPPAA
jgi:hypothetical protein